MAMTPAQRRLRAQIAANTRWAHEQDRTAATAAARRAAITRFENEVDPERKLLPAERQRRARSAQAAHMARMQLARTNAGKGKSKT